jgi:hypothetical protein
MTTTLLDTLRSLQASLDELAGSLQAVDAGAVLRAEEPLATAVSAVSHIRRTDVDGADPQQIREAITVLRATLRRCQALGETAEALGQTVTPQLAYGRGGRRVGASPAFRHRHPLN